MKKTKIYLAKSNRANPEHVMHVRGLLENNPNIEVVEYTGGQYSHEPLLACDYLIVIPETKGGEVQMIGKGLTEQIRAFSGSDDSHLLYFNSRDKMMIFKSLTSFYHPYSLSVNDECDYINHADITSTGSYHSFNGILKSWGIPSFPNYDSKPCCEIPLPEPTDPPVELGLNMAPAGHGKPWVDKFIEDTKNKFLMKSSGSDRRLFLLRRSRLG